MTIEIEPRLKGKNATNHLKSTYHLKDRVFTALHGLLDKTDDELLPDLIQTIRALVGVVIARHPELLPDVSEEDEYCYNCGADL